jgi:large repetitive protein
MQRKIELCRKSAICRGRERPLRYIATLAAANPCVLAITPGCVQTVTWPIVVGGSEAGRRARRLSAMARSRAARIFWALLAVGALLTASPVYAQSASFTGAIETRASGLGLCIGGVAVDSSDNVYFCNYNGTAGGIAEILAAGSYATTKTLSSAVPMYNLAVDGSGDIFYVNLIDGDVDEILAAGGYTTVKVLGTGFDEFNDPRGLALDGSGNVYVTDWGNGTSSQGAAYEMLAASGYTTVRTLSSSFNQPDGITVDASGDVFVADTSNFEVKEIVAVNGSIPATPEINVLGGGFSFFSPEGVAVDGSGNVMVADAGKNAVFEILSTGGYTTVNTLGSGFSSPDAVAVDASGNVFVADAGNRALKEIVRAGGNFGSVTVGSSSTSSIPMAFSFSALTELGSPVVVTEGASGLDFANAGTGTCTANASFSSGETCTVNVTFNPAHPGPRDGGVELVNTSGDVVASGYVQGIGSGPQVNFSPGTQSTVVSGSSYLYAYGATVDATGDIFVAEANGNVVEIPQGCSASTCVKTLGSGFNSPTGVAVDGLGNVFVADRGANEVKEILAAGGYTTVNTLGSGFNDPNGVAVDGSGNVYVADTGNGAVKEVLASGGYTTVTTLSDTFNGGDLPADDNEPTGVAVDGSGDVYVANYGYSAAYEIVAVNGSIPASPTINTLGSGFIYPYGIALDGGGSVYVCNTSGSNTVKEIVAVNGSIPASPTILTLGSGFNTPLGVAVDGSGNVFVSDSGNTRMVKLDDADAPALSFAQTNEGTTSSDSPKTVTVEDEGNATLNFSEVTYPADFPQGSSAGGECTSSSTLAPGNNCTLTVDFSPVATIGQGDSNPLSEDVTVITESALATTTNIYEIAVTGTETNPSPTAAAPVFSPPAGTYSAAQSVTITDATTGSAIYYTTNGTTPASSSAKYTSGSPITVSSTETLEAIAVAAGYENSPVTSATYTISVPLAATTTSLAVSPNPASYGATVNFTATVAGSAGTPGGSVTIDDGATAIATASLSNGMASGTLSNLAVGTHSLTANYSGDANDQSSASAAVTLTIAPISVQVIAPSSTSVAPGGSLTANITVGSANNYAGTVSLSCAVAYQGTGSATDLPSCAVNPASVTLTAGGSATAMMTVTTSAESASVKESGSGELAAGGLGVGGLLLLWLFRRRKRIETLLALVLLASFTWTGCNNSTPQPGTTSNPGTSAGTYTVTLTSTAGTVNTTESLTITVQ